MATRAAAKTAWERWFIKEAYPLYATIGLGVGACAFHLTRLAFFNPDSHLGKQARQAGIPETERDLTRGSNYYNHGIRRAVAHREIGIFPNSMFTKATDHDDD